MKSEHRELEKEYTEEQVRERMNNYMARGMANSIQLAPKALHTIRHPEKRKWLGAIVCWWHDAHQWRRRRNGEPIGTKTCERCGKVQAVKARKVKA